MLTERAPEMCNSHIIIYHKKCKIVTLAIMRQKSQQTTIPSWAHLDLVRLSHYCVRTDWETVLLFREDRLRDCPFMVCGQTERLSLYGVRADWETAPLLREDRLRDCPFIAWGQTEKLSLYCVRTDWETGSLLREDRLRDCPFIAWGQT